MIALISKARVQLASGVAKSMGMAAGLALIILGAGFSPGLGHAQSAGHSHAPYAGQQSRDTTALSADDQQELLKGEGWGLAKAAEFNGAPGPAHLLELKKEIGLSAEQVKDIEAMHAQMKAQAIKLGKTYIKTEQDIDNYFRSGQFSDEALRQKVDAAAQALANLRFLHLSYHHRTLEVVTPTQVATYNKLRGYAATPSDPCANIPAGHDPAMFRKHMGCKP